MGKKYRLCDARVLFLHARVNTVGNYPQTVASGVYPERNPWTTQEILERLSHQTIVYCVAQTCKLNGPHKFIIFNPSNKIPCVLHAEVKL